MNANVPSTTEPNTNEFLPSAEYQSHSQAIGAAHASQEVLGAIFAAKRFPRDEFSAFERVMTCCKRRTLAEAATYMYPRGGTSVTGPSIRLAEVLAASWGNIDYGIRELEQHEGYSEMQAYAWDLETNVRRTINFTVKHERHTKQGSYELEDPRDIYEMTANQGSRRVRACILALIPADVREKAVAMCKQTIAKGSGEPLEDLIKKLVLIFKPFGVTVELIEARLGHKLSTATPEEYADLLAIYNSIKDNHANRDQYFSANAGKPIMEDPKPKTKQKPKAAAPQGNAPEAPARPAEPEPAEQSGGTADQAPVEADDAGQGKLNLRPKLPPQSAETPDERPGAFQVEAARRVAALGWNAARLEDELITNFNVRSLIEIEVAKRPAVLAHFKSLLNSAGK